LKWAKNIKIKYFRAVVFPTKDSARNWVLNYWQRWVGKKGMVWAKISTEELNVFRFKEEMKMRVWVWKMIKRNFNGMINFGKILLNLQWKIWKRIESNQMKKLLMKVILNIFRLELFKRVKEYLAKWKVFL
jgi:hypothetical protein